jgi:hypothetical protein
VEINSFDVLKEMGEHNEDIVSFPLDNVTKVNAGKKKGWGFVEVAIGKATAAKLMAGGPVVFALIVADAAQFTARKEAMLQAAQNARGDTGDIDKLVAAAREETVLLNKGKRWQITIPARPENSDVVIGEALLAQEREIERLRRTLASIREIAGEDIREGRADVPSALFQIEADARAALWGETSLSKEQVSALEDPGDAE